MNNDIVLYANGKEYHTVLGCTIEEEFSETLDSATIVLDNVAKEDRLDIKPYDFVRIKNIGEGYPLDREMLVDSFVETEKNISQHIYYYQITLMSETKLLEKKQCPNLTISHSERFGKKSIATHLSHYLDLYVPRAKTMTDVANLRWGYKPIISYTKSELESKFSDDCADMAMTSPTLRQLLTNLMLQKSCIPQVSERKLSWIDLSEEPTTFNENAKGLNAIQRSNSSDSFVNALASMSEQLLDTSNKVIAESVGFRDPDNVFLKQAENLKLHTSFPIYNVTKCNLTMPVVTNEYVRVYNENFEVNGKWFPAFTARAYVTDGSLASITNTSPLGYVDVYHDVSAMEKGVTIKDAKMVFLSQEYSTSEFSVLKQVDFSVNLSNYDDNNLVQTRVSVPSDLQTEEASKTYFFYITMIVARGTGEEIRQSTMLLPMNLAYCINNKTESYDYYIKSLPIDFVYVKEDITPNVVENAKRQLLDTDYTTMPTSDDTTAEELAKWIYGTVGYSIGGQEIAGFSNTYSFAQGWWNSSKTYFENMLDVLLRKNGWFKNDEMQSTSEKAYRAFLGGYEGSFGIKGSKYLHDSFATAVFDIEYQPLNSMTFKTYKNEILFDIEQLDNTASGLTDFDRFAKNSQQKTNRLGNDIMTINQTTDDITQIQPLNSKYEDSIVFKRTISLNKNYVQVNYALSKDYVMKNYFTSISTKYRAYEHIDYNQATIRKEHINVFVTLDTDNHQGMDDRIVLGYTVANAFLGGLLPHDTNRSLRYALEQSKNEQGSEETVKYDISIVANDNALAFIHQPWFNIGNGSYLTALEATEGGLPQSYQIWGDEYYERKILGYVPTLDLYAEHTDDGVKSITKEPIVDNSYAYEISMKIVNDMTKSYLTQWKDEGETINTTVQFTYVNKCEDFFIFSEELIRNAPIADISEYGYANAIVVVDNKKFKKFGKEYLKPYPNQEGNLWTADDGTFSLSDYVEINDNALTLKPIATALLSIPYKIVHAYKNAKGEWEWVDLAMVEGSHNTQTVYVYLNDTNTLKVMCEDDYKVLRPMYEDDGTGNKKAKAL